MIEEVIVSVLKKVIGLLVKQDYERIFIDDRDKDWPASDMQEMIEGFGAKAIGPLDFTFDELDIYDTNEPDCHHILLDLILDREPSDLTLSVRVWDSGEFAIQNIRVL